jgi:hypothetical protein
VVPHGYSQMGDTKRSGTGYNDRIFYGQNQLVLRKVQACRSSDVVDMLAEKDALEAT